MDTKLYAVTEANGRPLSIFMTAGQVGDYTGTSALLSDLTEAQWLLGDRGYDAEWLRDALKSKGIQQCIPGRGSRLEANKYDKRRYSRRSRIEIMFGLLTDWRRVATRYDKRPTVFLSAIALMPPSSSGFDQRALILVSRSPRVIVLPTAMLAAPCRHSQPIKSRAQTQSGY